MKPYHNRLATRLALMGGLGILAVSPTVPASGFAIPEYSIAGIGTSNALVANPEELGAIVYNPAAMSFHQHSSVTAGLMFFMPTLEVTTTSGHQESDGESTVPIPNLQGALKVNKRVSIGLGVTAPFGLETVWPLGTFPKLSTPIPVAPGLTQPPGRFHPTQSKLELVSIIPTVAFRVNENLGLAAGVDYYNARELKFNTGLVRINGDGDGWGWNLAAIYRSGPFSVGASYHSKAKVDLDGSLAAPGLPSVNAKADLDLPFRFQLGVRYALTDKLAAELDWTRTGWNNFTEIVVSSTATGAVLTRSANYWDNADAFRLGMTYDVTPETQLRLGYTYDQTGQTNEYFTARIPDADRQLFSIGAAHSFGSGWQLEGGYMYVLLDDNNYRGNRPFDPAHRDPNGTSALDGKYEGHVHIFGIGINKAFM